MPRDWTPDQVASLAPDAASLKAGRGLATPRKWTVLAHDDSHAWGLAQGSGAKPYQVQVDLGEPAFKCSCPSRKFPCKHGLGLLFLLAGDASSFTTQDRPDWVQEWVAKREERATKQSARAEAASSPDAPPADPAAQAKRREKRTALVASGVDFLHAWLRDLVRQGLATATAGTGYAFWDEPARRLVDAQAAGLARQLRHLGTIAAADSHQLSAPTLAALARLHLLVRANQQRDALSADWQAEIDAQTGWTVDQDALRQNPGVAGTWFVGAQSSHEEDRIITRSSLLFSASGEVARLLEFSPAARPAVATLALGRWCEGELVFFPGLANQRALWKQPPHEANPTAALTFADRCHTILDTHAARLAVNPLVAPTPVAARLTPVRHDERLWLRDESGDALPIVEPFALGWELLACAGGAPVALFGEWNGFAFRPLSVLTEHGIIALTAEAAPLPAHALA